MLALCLPAPPALAEHWKSIDYLVDSFVLVALGNEYESKPQQVRKWVAPIRYALVHGVGDADLHERMARAQLDHLARITGLDIQPAGAAERATLRIVFSHEARLRDDMQSYLGWSSAAQRERFFRETVCLGVIRAKRGRITSATALIPVDRARSRGKLLACVVEELTQVLGLPNDSDRVFPSVFNDRSIDDRLSGLDVLLLKMLYDGRLLPGMDEAAARPLLRRIAADLTRDDGYAEAEREAATGGPGQLTR